MCHELEQPRLFVATLTPLFNKTLGLGHVGITNTSFQYFCSNIIHLQHLPVYFQQIKRNKGIALKAGFKLYDGFSVKTTQLFQRHNCANFADFGDKTKITSALHSFLLRIIQCRYYAPAIGRAGEFFFNIIFLKVDGSVHRSCFVHRCSKRQSNRSNATFRLPFPISLPFQIQNGGQTGPNCFPRKDNTTKHAKKRPLSSESKFSVRNGCETTSAPSN